WGAFHDAVPSYSTATLRLGGMRHTIQFTYLDNPPQHERAFNRITFDADTLDVKQHDRYADRSLAGRLLASVFPLHSGAYFGWPVQILTMLAAFTLPLFPITGWMMYLIRRRAAARDATEDGTVSSPG